GLLCQKSVSEVGCPLDVIGQSLDDVRQSCQALNACIPTLLLHCVCESFVLQILVLSEPLVQLNQLERVGRSCQHLREQRIGIERNGSNKRIELIVWNFGSLVAWLRLLSVLWRECDRGRDETNRAKKAYSRSPQRVEAEHGYTCYSRLVSHCGQFSTLAENAGGAPDLWDRFRGDPRPRALYVLTVCSPGHLAYSASLNALRLQKV